MRQWEKILLNVLTGVDKSETWLEMCQIALIGKELWDSEGEQIEGAGKRGRREDFDRERGKVIQGRVKLSVDRGLNLDRKIKAQKRKERKNEIKKKGKLREERKKVDEVKERDKVERE